MSGLQTRRSDIAYLTREQIASPKQGKYEIPEFVIEIISGSEKANNWKKKQLNILKQV